MNTLYSDVNEQQKKSRRKILRPVYQLLITSAGAQAHPQ
jgi:hypothetical protein